jgi:hypothetical protein
MEAGYKRALKKFSTDCVYQSLPGLVPYDPTKAELRTFLGGSLFFRKEIAPEAFVYLVISPASGKECSFTVLLGWGFGDDIAEHNYLEQFRELGGRIWPTRRYLSGFEQLEVLENAKAAWGESLPEVQALQQRYGSVTSEVQDAVVRHSLMAALHRTRAIFPAFVAAIQVAAP